DNSPAGDPLEASPAAFDFPVATRDRGPFNTHRGFRVSSREADMDDFRPPWFLRNRHIQTILGHLWSGPRFREPTRRHRVAVSEGDQLVVHDSAPAGWQPGDPIAVLIHGL